jgi:hypothetical protein
MDWTRKTIFGLPLNVASEMWTSNPVIFFDSNVDARFWWGSMYSTQTWSPLPNVSPRLNEFERTTRLQRRLAFRAAFNLRLRHLPHVAEVPQLYIDWPNTTQAAHSQLCVTSVRPRRLLSRQKIVCPSNSQ